MESLAHLTVFRAAVDSRLQHCDLCPWDCRVDRLAGEQGVCKLGRDARVFFAGVEHAEQPAWINPTFSIYTAGCNLRCSFCAAGEHVARPGIAPAGDVAATVRAFERASRETAIASISFCGGEPGVALPTVLDLVAALPDRFPPLVWNSNLYVAPDLLPSLARLFDLFLPDLHFGNTTCAESLGGGRGYFELVSSNLMRLHALGARMRVRHLLRPGHVACCFVPVATWVAKNLKGCGFDLLEGYTPSHREAASAALDAREIEIARTWMVELGFVAAPSDVTDVVIDGGSTRFWQSNDAAWACAKALTPGGSR